MTLRIGNVGLAFTNAEPYRLIPPPFPVEWVEVDPSELTARMLDGSLDVALLPTGAFPALGDSHPPARPLRHRLPRPRPQPAPLLARPHWRNFGGRPQSLSSRRAPPPPALCSASSFNSNSNATPRFSPTPSKAPTPRSSSATTPWTSTATSSAGPSPATCASGGSSRPASPLSSRSGPAAHVTAAQQPTPHLARPNPHLQRNPRRPTTLEASSAPLDSTRRQTRPLRLRQKPPPVVIAPGSRCGSSRRRLETPRPHFRHRITLIF